MNRTITDDQHYPPTKIKRGNTFLYDSVEMRRYHTLSNRHKYKRKTKQPKIILSKIPYIIDHTEMENAIHQMQNERKRIVLTNKSTKINHYS
jgi:hypothetical protein